MTDIKAPERATGPSKKCPDCAETVLVGANVCKHCGFRFDGKPRVAKSPGVAAVLSIVFWGAGHMYAGRLGLGLFLLLIDAIGIIATVATAGVGAVFGVPYAIYVMVHAYKSAESANRGEVRSATVLVTIPLLLIAIIVIVGISVLN